MEIRITTRQILIVLLIFAWIIFVGLCIETGGFLTSIAVAIIDPSKAMRFYRMTEFTSLFNFDRGEFFVVTGIISVIGIMKAWLFYLIIRILQTKKLDLTNPFSEDLRRFIFGLSYIAFLIGLFSYYGIKYSYRLMLKGVQMPDAQTLHLGGADVWLFMAIILYVIAQIFKRGIEIQKENELTI